MHRAVWLSFVATPLFAQQAPASGPVRPLTPAGVHADLAIVREQFIARDASFSPDARKEALDRVARLDAMADTVHRAWFELELSRIAALADNGHTGVPAVVRASRFNRLPVRLAPMGQELYVMAALPPYTELLGARVTGIDGKSVTALRAMASPLVGGTAAWRDRSLPLVVESPQLLHALGAATDANAVTVAFELANGRALTRRLVAEAPDSVVSLAASSRWFSTTPFTGDRRTWTTLLKDADAPWSLRDWPVRFRWRAAPEVDGVVIELRQNVDAAGQPIAAFLDSTLRTLEAMKPHNIVLDMRFNGGGNLQTTRAFAQRLPTLATGRVFALTSPYTFSAAISTVAYLKQADPARVTIVGEEVGDRLQFFAEGGPVMLPNSGIGIGVATERHDYKTGCKPFPDCHGPVVRYPISVPSLAPDIAAPWTMSSYRAGRDPGIDAVAVAIKRRS